jgi:hypothetical protein
MNYIIPEGFDFYKELTQKIESDSSSSSSSCNNVCLIDGTPLTKSHIKLECGHTFNYIPLLNDAYEEKYHRAKNYSYYSYSNRRLSDNQLRCPYCRNIQNKILPYFPDMYLEKVRGINTPSSLSMGENKCNHMFKSGKNKGSLCGKKCYRDKCPQHYKTELDFDNVEKTVLSLRKYTVTELKKMAKHYKITKYSKLKKNDLINKIINI